MATDKTTQPAEETTQPAEDSFETARMALLEQLGAQQAALEQQRSDAQLQIAQARDILRDPMKVSLQVQALQQMRDGESLVSQASGALQELAQKQAAARAGDAPELLAARFKQRNAEEMANAADLSQREADFQQAVAPMKLWIAKYGAPRRDMVARQILGALGLPA